jgi:hypothetical protein
MKKVHITGTVSYTHIAILNFDQNISEMKYHTTSTHGNRPAQKIIEKNNQIKFQNKRVT